MKQICYLVPLYLFLPSSVFASIEISEVAWMGSADSANHEWIELYNDSAALEVTGWTVTDGNNILIALEGLIPANSHVVLERTSDNSAPGTAFSVYTGALGNGGATLTLRDESGALVDQVVGGTDWNNIGGDNETKETAQKTNAGWVTAAATPGTGVDDTTTSVSVADGTTAESVTTGTTAADKKATANTTQTKKKKDAGEAIVLTLPDVTLQLDITAPAFVHVNQPVTFSVKPSGIGDTLTDSLQYIWNFGDGTTGSGEETKHTFTHPGTYVVVVEGGYKRQQQVTRTQIQVLPVELSITINAKGDVTILNQGEDEIDLSRYRLVGHETFVFPQYSILLPGQTIVVPASKVKTGTTKAMVVLYDQEHTAIAMTLPQVKHHQNRGSVVLTEPKKTLDRVVTATPRISAFSHSPVSDDSPTRTAERFTFVNSQTVRPSAGVPIASAGGLRATSQVAAAVTPSRTLPGGWPLYTLIAILLFGILSIFLIPTQPRGED